MVIKRACARRKAMRTLSLSTSPPSVTDRYGTAGSRAGGPGQAYDRRRHDRSGDCASTCAAIRVAASAALFLAVEDTDGNPREGKVLAQLVLQEARVAVADVLREVGEEGEGRHHPRQLVDVLDAHALSLDHRRRMMLDLRQ